MSTPEPLHDLARGDVAVSRQLSIALRTIMNGTADPGLKNQIRAILEGRSSARDLMHSDAFNLILDQTLPAAMQQFADMPEEERQRLAAQGEAQLEQLRNQPAEQSPPTQPYTAATPESSSPTAGTVHAGTRKPNRDRIVTPDEPDEDDDYFRDRRENGWLR
ncbi:hypothetical protein ACTWPB_00815 [Nocardia sp. IBHARD005]|uniref:hypothetical protein n=1 Tax=Nocardia sp. IBHARD005 TaxID=3457765 RepID=UPI00405A207A